MNQRWYLLHDSCRVNYLGRHEDFESAERVAARDEAGFEGPGWIVDHHTLASLEHACFNARNIKDPEPEFDKMNILNIASATANMMDGLVDGRKFSDITEAWNEGFLELTQRLGEVAMYGEQQIMLLEPEQDFPGVYDYEVSHEFGRWFGETLVGGDGDTSFKTCCAKLDVMREEFFNRP